MKVSIIYDSITGNTKKLADLLKEKFSNIVEIDEADIVFVGSWTDKGNPSQKIQDELKRIKNKKIFYFGTCGFGGNKEYFDMLFERAKKFIDESNEIIGHFYCQGKMPISVRKRYEQMLKDNPNDEKMKKNIENFDMALNHPSKEDLEDFNIAIEKAIKI